MPLKDLAQRKAYAKARYQATSTAILAEARVRRAANLDAARAGDRARSLTRDQDKKAARQSEWYQANRETLLARAKDNPPDPQKRQEWERAHYHNHREEIRASNRAWRLSHQDDIRALRKAYSDAHRVAINAKQKAWYVANKLKSFEHSARRRALKRSTQVEKVDFAQILYGANGLCGICGEPFDELGIHFDHIVPLSRGGTHTRENIQATHAHCNRSKGARMA